MSQAMQPANLQADCNVEKGAIAALLHIERDEL